MSGSARAWLVTGGAGYIGSHVVGAMRATGRTPVVLDDLSTGVLTRLPSDVVVVRADVRDRDAVTATLRRHRIRGVLHLAARKSVAESFREPGTYYRENVGGLRDLLAVMVDARVRRLVLSSSAAVYDPLAGPLLTEASATVPPSPYGWTKLVGEDLARLAGDVAGLSWIALRYFNVLGAGADDLGDHGGPNLLPTTFRMISQGQAPRIHGDDHATVDGTPVRDFVHVLDVADAHVAAAFALDQGVSPNRAYNVGTGTGTSVRQLLGVVREVTGAPLDPVVGPRRTGDASAVIASPDAIRHDLGWTARHDVASMVDSAWRSHVREQRRDEAVTAGRTG